MQNRPERQNQRRRHHGRLLEPGQGALRPGRRRGHQRRQERQVSLGRKTREKGANRLLPVRLLPVREPQGHHLRPPTGLPRERGGRGTCAGFRIRPSCLSQQNRARRPRTSRSFQGDRPPVRPVPVSPDSGQARLAGPGHQGGQVLAADRSAIRSGGNPFHSTNENRAFRETSCHA